MEKQNFLPLDGLLGSNNKVFINCHSFFWLACSFRNGRDDGMTKTYVMWLSLTIMRYFLSSKEQKSAIFVKEEFLYKKIQKNKFFFGDLTTNLLRGR